MCKEFCDVERGNALLGGDADWSAEEGAGIAAINLSGALRYIEGLELLHERPHHSWDEGPVPHFARRVHGTFPQIANMLELLVFMSLPFSRL
jgi:hypothetical protein